MRWLVMAAAWLLLAACAGPEVASPAPVLEAGDQRPAPRQPSGAPPQPGPRSAAPLPAEGRESAAPIGDRSAPAALALARRAERQRAAGDPERAAATLERGLRIAPRAALLWHRLARLRLEQGEPGRALGLAERALGLYRSDPAGRAACWRTIAAAHRRLGEDEAARAAQDMARRLDAQR